MAPFTAAASVAPPVYAKRFNTLTGVSSPFLIRFSFSVFIRFPNQSQFVACSGKRPVCLKLNGFKLNVSLS